MTEGHNSRRVLAATCRVHPGPAGFTNLVVSRESGRVVFEPHVDGSCGFSLDEGTARRLTDALQEWFG